MGVVAAGTAGAGEKAAETSAASSWRGMKCA
jgi:hypothetical protein